MSTEHTTQLYILLSSRILLSFWRHLLVIHFLISSFDSFRALLRIMGYRNWNWYNDRDEVQNVFRESLKIEMEVGNCRVFFSLSRRFDSVFLSRAQHIECNFRSFVFFVFVNRRINRNLVFFFRLFSLFVAHFFRLLLSAGLGPVIVLHLLHIVEKLFQRQHSIS